jgi:hypothetical protein
LICSVAIRKATNSLPKAFGSTVFCFLLNQDAGTLLMKIKAPVWLRQATTLPA